MYWWIPVAVIGLAGIVITDKRFVYHKTLSQAEFDIHDKINIEKSEGKNGSLKLGFSCGPTRVKGFTSTEPTLKQIKKYLADANHNTLAV